MKIMDGKLVSKIKNEELKEKISYYKNNYNISPKLAIILVGDDPASLIYVNSKIKTAKSIGIDAQLFKFNQDTEEAEVLNTIEKINNDYNFDGIIVQLPLPKHIDSSKVLDKVDYKKDVDGFSVINQGYLFQKRNAIISATPKGIINLLKYYNIEIKGKDACVIGRSLIVGLPISKLLLDENATVTTCHRYTKNLKKYTKHADILVVAAGQKHLITKDMVKKNVVIVDVGINREDKKIYGDVDFENVKEKASFITPVPGGVGPMTINALLENVFENFVEKIKNKEK